MKIETHYSLEDEVYVISRRSESKTVACPTCDGNPPKFADGSSPWCRVCHGDGHVRWAGRNEWQVIVHGGAVGQVKVEAGRDGTKVQYMLDPTGIGTGTNWNEKDVYGSPQEAKAECGRRNKGIKWEKY